jgi:hypothetical protein
VRSARRSNFSSLSSRVGCSSTLLLPSSCQHKPYRHLSDQFSTHASLRAAIFPALREVRKEGLIKAVIGAFLIVSALCCLTVVGGAWAQTTWVDEISNSLAFSTANYPSSNWEPYHQKLGMLREAVSRGDNQAVKGRWANGSGCSGTAITASVMGRRRAVQLFPDGDTDPGIWDCGPGWSGRSR